MTKDEALKLALEALERSVSTCFTPFAYEEVMCIKHHFVNETITAIKEALAHLEQEPVAWWNDTGTHIDLNVSGRGTPLYTTPPQRTWVGLTRTELIKCGVLPFGMSYELCKAIETRLKDKNI